MWKESAQHPLPKLHGFPLVTLWTKTADVSSIMSHTGYAILIYALERSKPATAKSLNATRFGTEIFAITQRVAVWQFPSKQ